ncbi:MAG: MBOAT family protein [Ruminococcaceae bacterium]|nr:MBOAT family protein [Oscillospiraceae bacterium]
MVFSSYEFIFIFLPLVLLLYFSTYQTPKLQSFILAISSLYFYGYFNFYYLFIILASIVINFILGHFINHANKTPKPLLAKLLLILAIAFNIGLLGYFKYYDFFVENINAVFKTDFILKNILLPLGISFFTFQQFSFILSIYKQEEKIEGFLDYTIFVTFFPQLVAGPIVTYSEMMPQFVNPQNRRFNSDNFQIGLFAFACGMFKKLVIADTLNIFVNNGFGNSSLSMAAAWATAISYTLQIYFDFSGYSDMAIGLGKMFNINLPVNFFSPYKSESISEFWKRWHITLGRALKSYIYIPLGGNRKGKLRTYMNYMATFILSGLWHGASWNFVLWGGLNGFFIVLEKIFSSILKKIPRVIKIAVTFIITNFLWVLFRASDFHEAAMLYRQMFDIHNIGLQKIAIIVQDGIFGMPSSVAVCYFLFIAFILLFIVFFKKNTIENIEAFKSNMQTSLVTALIITVSIIFLSRESAFIYFNF